VSLVVDSSVVVAALVDQGADGSWARAQLKHERLMAPHHMPAEVANVLRRAARSDQISAETATLGHEDLLQLRVTFFGYTGFGMRVLELRANLSAYDAWYVALAEQLDAPLVTLDRRLALAAGPRCEFRVPPARDTIQTGME
jgi:predicted nucleic acid-binding protein